MTTLRKGDLVAAVAGKLGGTRSQAEEALNAVLDAVRDSLTRGDRVVLTGFGSFEVRQVGARKVRAIRGAKAGSLTNVPAHKRVGFRPGTELTQAVRK